MQCNRNQVSGSGIEDFMKEHAATRNVSEKCPTVVSNDATKEPNSI